MTIDTEAGVAPETVQNTRSGAPSRLRLLRTAVTPIVLAIVLGVLWYYDTHRTLDRFEQRTLNGPFLLARTREHLVLTAYVTVLVLAIAIPLGVLLTRRSTRRLATPVIALANIGQAVPSIGVLILLYLLFTDLGATPIAIIAFVAYSTLPVLRNTMVGLQQVDRAVIEAARGVGMTKAGVLWRIELPLAVPVILAGVRTALVISVGTVALATFIGARGLGDVIDSGISSNRSGTLITGAVLVAVLALAVDWLAGVAEEIFRPRGLS